MHHDVFENNLSFFSLHWTCVVSNQCFAKLVELQSHKDQILIKEKSWKTFFSLFFFLMIFFFEALLFFTKEQINQFLHNGLKCNVYFCNAFVPNKIDWIQFSFHSHFFFVKLLYCFQFKKKDSFSSFFGNIIKASSREVNQNNSNLCSHVIF